MFILGFMPRESLEEIIGLCTDSEAFGAEGNEERTTFGLPLLKIPKRAFEGSNNKEKAKESKKRVITGRLELALCLVKRAFLQYYSQHNF
jgi:hypothetical protein